MIDQGKCSKSECAIATLRVYPRVSTESWYVIPGVNALIEFQARSDCLLDDLVVATDPYKVRLHSLS